MFSADDVARQDAFFGRHEAKAAVIRAGHQHHALAFNATQFAWREVDEERDLASDDVLGGEVLEHVLWSFELPVLGKVKTTSALPFDIGVYFVVIGLVLMAYEAFGDDPDDVTERLAAGGAS